MIDTAAPSPTSSLQRHITPFAWQVGTRPAYSVVDRSIMILVPSGRHRDIVAMLGGSWPYASIKLWRYGHRAPPREAVAILCARLGEMQRVCAELAGELPKLPGPGRGSHRNICKWNRTRAMMRENMPPK